jgi:hypothetical protein
MGVDQAYGNYLLSRATGVWYQNTTNKGIFVVTRTSPSGAATASIGESTVSFTTINQDNGDSGENQPLMFIVPAGYYYQVNSGAGLMNWWEMR